MSGAHQIQPLTEAYLDDVLQLLQETFPEDYDDARQEVLASLDPQAYPHIFDKTGYEIIVSSLHFWVFVHGYTRKAIGLIGLYETVEDHHEAYWGNWFVTAPQYQKLGVGMRLASFLAEKVITSDKTYLRAWTTQPETEREKRAHRIYEYFGLKMTHTLVLPQSEYPHEIVIFERRIPHHIGDILQYPITELGTPIKAHDG